jgi:hypothetical protein
MATINNTITIQAPAFAGVNTQDTPLAMGYQYAFIAENCLIDKYGRISTRNGWVEHTATTSEVTGVFELPMNDGSYKLIHTTSDMSVYVDNVEVTPLGLSGTNSNWKFANLNNRVYMYAEGNTPLVVYDNAGVPTCVLASAFVGASGTQPNGVDCVSAYGRLWVVANESNTPMLYWSDLFIGNAWTAGSAGYVNLTTVFEGKDVVTAVVAHNGFIIIFGERQTVIYSGAESDPTNKLVLSDNVVGVGCIARDSVQNTGNDVLFLSASGLKSLNRLVQEKSLPLRDVSLNIRNELLSMSQPEKAKSFYSERLNLYFLSFGKARGYAFNLSGVLENGAYRVTTWNGSVLGNAYYVSHDRELYIAKDACVAQYGGYTDGGGSFLFRYTTGYLDFDQPVLAKFLKDVTTTVTIKGIINLKTKWAYDYLTNYQTFTNIIQGDAVSEYGIAEYGIGKFGEGDVFIRSKASTSGQGIVVQIGLEAPINNAFLSLQRIDVYTTTGRRI